MKPLALLGRGTLTKKRRGAVKSAGGMLMSSLLLLLLLLLLLQDIFGFFLARVESRGAGRGSVCCRSLGRSGAATCSATALSKSVKLEVPP